MIVQTSGGIHTNCGEMRSFQNANGDGTEVLISPYPDQEGNKLMFLSEWREFPSAPCLAEGKKYLMTARVSMLLKSRVSLTCFRACFLPGRAKGLSATGITRP